MKKRPTPKPGAGLNSTRCPELYQRPVSAMVPLRNDTLAACAERIATPSYDRARLTAGVVHIGVGGFHRAHQAMYHERLMSRGEALDWAIRGIGVMPGDRRMQAVMEP